ncbi:MAG: SnoaL-like domain-containing protein, partial [Gemmatimonadetes bacterium]|nr:SnoaL-like domain-containing protein [Gemmatimonadota bacterium]
AIEEEDLDRYASHLHPDFTSFGETDLYLNEGKDYELRAYADYMTRVDGVHTEMHQPSVTVQGDVAWITYYWTDAGTRADGERFTSRGKSTRIFVREDGRWLCIHGHYTLAGS